jgi:hypothetical protein
MSEGKRGAKELRDKAENMGKNLFSLYYHKKTEMNTRCFNLKGIKWKVPVPYLYQIQLLRP